MCGGLSPAALAICGLPSLPDLWAWAGQRYGNSLAIVDRHRKPATSLTFSQLHEAIQSFAAGLNALGVRRGERHDALLHSIFFLIALPVRFARKLSQWWRWLLAWDCAFLASGCRCACSSSD